MESSRNEGGGKTQKRRGVTKYSLNKNYKSSHYSRKSKIISKPKYNDQIDEINAILKQKYGEIIKNNELEKYIIKNYRDTAGNITPGVNGISYDPSRDHLINGESQTEIEMYKEFITWMGNGADKNNLPSWIIYVNDPYQY